MNYIKETTSQHHSSDILGVKKCKVILPFVSLYEFAKFNHYFYLCTVFLRCSDWNLRKWGSLVPQRANKIIRLDCRKWPKGRQPKRKERVRNRSGNELGGMTFGERCLGELYANYDSEEWKRALEVLQIPWNNQENDSDYSPQESRFWGVSIAWDSVSVKKSEIMAK